jgi:hypothetical protein
MTPQVLYIDGDSWIGHSTPRVVNDANPLFKDMLIINNAVPASSNIDIITRTDRSLRKLKQLGIEPMVCVCLSEVGRDHHREFSLVQQKYDDISDFLNDVLTNEVLMIKKILKNYNYYLCNGWTQNSVLSELSIVNFIDQDFDKIAPVYSVGNPIYSWLNNNFKFNQTSFVEAVDNKQKFQKLLLKNPNIDNTLHPLWPHSKAVYQGFFEHVLATLRAQAVLST